MKLETVKVKTADGYKIINKDDFDPKRHELYEKPAAKKGAAKPAAKKD